ncbi:MAG: YicC/YloC family endoribonuclease [Limisphaerales bacterium]|jgi:uncharacterized protein (TIGR00255 family)|nr:YicC/YloC family endoribonuclease [Verrucomicrobiota bacterium]
MTGYGGGEASKMGIRVTVDVSSLNRKQSELSISLPGGMESLDSAIREFANPLFSRGRLTIRVGVQTLEESHAIRFNEKVAQHYLKELSAFAKKLKIDSEIPLEKILEFPGVVESQTTRMTPEDAWPLIESALKKAMKELIAMRGREGRHLRAELVKRVNGLKKILKKIETESKGLPEKYRKALLKRIQAAKLELIDEEDPRIIQEVVFFADRSDITEEITRLKSHFAQFKHATQTGKPVGRMLDFLAQEMGREINTIASKANDAVISACCVEFKAELEKFREQVQNVE